MARGSDNSVFLERRNYRRRRMIDAAKLLPIIGAWLFMLPLLWPNDGSSGTKPLSYAWTYVFLIWLVLTTVGAGLALALGSRGAQEDEAAEGD